MSKSQKIFDKYGLTGELKSVAANLEQRLGIKFETRESSFRGGDYFLYKSHAEGELLLQLNFVGPDKDDWEQPKHKEFSLIFYVNDSPRFKDIQNLIEDEARVKLLDRSST